MSMFDAPPDEILLSEVMDQVANKLNVPRDTFPDDLPTETVTGHGTADEDADGPSALPVNLRDDLIEAIADTDLSAEDVPAGESSPTAPPAGATTDEPATDDEPEGSIVIIPPGDEGEDEPIAAIDTPPADTADTPIEYAGTLDRFIATAYGADPTSIDTINSIQQSLNYVETLTALDEARQTMIGQIVAGTFDPLAWVAPDRLPQPTVAQPAPAPAPAQPQYDEWGYPVEVPTTIAPSTPTSDPRVDALAAEMAALRDAESARQLQIQQQQNATHQAQISALLTTGRDEFVAAHPELDQVDVAALMQSVNRAGAYISEVQRGVPANESYRRQLEAHLTTSPTLARKRIAAVDVNPSVPPVDETQAPARQARSAAIAGSSSPSSTSAPRRRSALGTDDAPTSPPAKNKGELAAQILAEMNAGQ